MGRHDRCLSTSVLSQIRDKLRGEIGGDNQHRSPQYTFIAALILHRGILHTSQTQVKSSVQLVLAVIFSSVDLVFCIVVQLRVK